VELLVVNNRGLIGAQRRADAALLWNCAPAWITPVSQRAGNLGSALIEALRRSPYPTWW